MVIQGGAVSGGVKTEIARVFSLLVSDTSLTYPSGSTWALMVSKWLVPSSPMGIVQRIDWVTDPCENGEGSG